MWALPTEPQKGDSLTRYLRKYFADNVKISKDDMKRAKQLVKDYVEDQIISYCEKNSPLPLLRLEYTGSMYERLKSEAADEVDLMLIVATTSKEVTVEKDPGFPGYARLRTNVDSPSCKYTDSQGYLIPAQIREAWLYSLVIKAANAFKMKLPMSLVFLRVSSHGPAVQLDIVLNGSKEILLSADLVPCFQVGSNNGSDAYFVAKPYEGKRFVLNPELLWRQSFSIKEKEKLANMDEDHGCRHELLRIVKTILKEDTTFGRLKSFHVKTAFMHYITNTLENWTGDSALEEHFLGFLDTLQNYLENGVLPHPYSGQDLLEDMDPKVVKNMANRLKRIKTKAKKFQQTCNQILLSQKLRQYSTTHVKTDTGDRGVQKMLFSLQGEQKLQFLDPHHGCMSELFWIVRTIIEKDGILYLLSAEDVNRAFLHYINTPRDHLWSGDDLLGEHFLGFFSALHDLLIHGHLLEDVSERNVADVVVNRCARIIASADERDKLLGGEIKWIWPWVQADDSLTRKLRDYSVNHVKVDENDMAYTRALVKDYIEDRVMWYCKQTSKLPILKVEYSGSVYERLQTEPDDKVTVMVVLKTGKSWWWGEDVSMESTPVTGYVRLKTRWNSKLRKYADRDRYLDPERLGSDWLYRLVDKAVEYFRDNSPSFYAHPSGPSVMLDVINNQTGEILLTADIIPCFEVESDTYYVAKPYMGRKYVSSPKLLWKQSFLLKEKEMLEDMESKDGCDWHKLFIIVIVSMESGPLRELYPYHLKTAFMYYYIVKRHEKWNDHNAFSRHFLGFLKELQTLLKSGNLPHFWLQNVNMLENFDQGLLEIMANRLERILNSRAEMNKLLQVSRAHWSPTYSPW